MWRVADSEAIKKKIVLQLLATELKDLQTVLMEKGGRITVANHTCTLHTSGWGQTYNRQVSKMTKTKYNKQAT
jgi:hypothetical protein